MKRREALMSFAAGMFGLYPFPKGFDISWISQSQSKNSTIRIPFHRLPKGFDRRIFHRPSVFEDKIVCEYCFNSGRYKVVPIKTEGHVSETHPFDSNLSIVYSRFSGTISIIDWRLQKEIALFEYPKGVHAYGHGAFSDDGKFIYVSSTDGYIRDEGGALYVLDSLTLKVVDTIRMPFGPPHDIISIGNNEFLFGTDGEDKQGAFTIFNSKTKKFFYFPISTENSKQNKILIHMERVGRKVLSNYQVKVASADDILRQGGIVSFDLDTKKIETVIPIGSFDVSSEMLSLKYDPVSSYFWYTVPAQNIVIVWDLKKQNLVTVIPMPARVSSVSFLPGIEAVLVGTKDSFYIYDSTKLTRNSKLESQLSFQKLAARGLYHTHTRIS